MSRRWADFYSPNSLYVIHFSSLYPIREAREPVVLETTSLVYAMHFFFYRL